MYKIPETEEEICRAYRLAKNKREQINILADFTQRTPAEIIEILERNGITHRRTTSHKGPRKNRMSWTPEMVSRLLTLRREGKSVREIADTMGLKYQQAENKLRRLS